MAFLNGKDKKAITPISNIFIDKYMPKANATFVKVYLYGYRNCYHDFYELTSKQIADTMDILESDVVLAWKYWEKEGLMKLQFNDKTNNYDVEYLPIEEVTESQSGKTVKFNPFSTKPQYSPQELSIYKDSSEQIRELFSYAQKTLNKLLTYTDMNVIFSFYDWLRLPTDIIKLLLAYYSDKSMKYIEKVAIDWAENGIDTIDKAEEQMKLYGEYRFIMKAFGISNRNSIGSEEEYMRKWIKTYKLPSNIIEEACKKTVLQTGKATFVYADQILTNWYKNNVKTIEDINKLETAFSEKKKIEAENRASKNSNPNMNTKKQNKFVNFEQRQWDFEELERLEREYIDKNLEG